MSRSNIRDFTQGSIATHLIAFSTPMLLGNVFQALYSTVDSFWVGRYLGSEALAAVSVSFPIQFALVSLAIGLTIATTTLISQSFGARNYPEIAHIAANTLTLLGLLGLIFATGGFLFRAALIDLVGTPYNIRAQAISYLGVCSLGFPVVYIYNVGGAILRGLGDSRTPLNALIVATVTNIILDPVMIFGLGPVPRMGVAGAALATIIAQAIASAVVIVSVFKTISFKRNWKDFLSLDRNITIKSFRIGLPSAVQQTLVSFGAMAVVSIVNSFGFMQAAVLGIGNRLDQFTLMPAMSISTAVSALVGQNLGAGKVERVRETVRTANKLSLGIAFCTFAVMQLFPRQIFSVFSKEAELLDFGVTYLRYVSIVYVPMSLHFVLQGVMRGAGDTIPPMLIALGALWLVRVPAALLLSRMPALGVSGVWMAFPISGSVTLLLNYIYYRKGKWANRKLVEKMSVQASLDEL